MRFFILFFSSFILVLLPLTSYALDPERNIDEYNSNQWGVDEQLPQVYVTALEQDRKGYIWIGTQSGLARFNGKEFVHFDSSNTADIKSNVINDLLIDNQDNLWILTDAGLTLLNQRGFVSSSDDNDVLVKPRRLLDYQGQILISTSNGLFKADNNSVQPYLISSESYALRHYSKGVLVGGRGELSFLSGNVVTTKALPDLFNKAIINDIQEVDQEIWLATSMGLLVYRDNTFDTAVDVTPHANEPISALFLDESNILWVASNFGMYRVKGHTLLHDKDINAYPNVSEFLLDKEGTFWIGTRDKGLIQLWDSWSVRYGQARGIKEDLIWSVAGNDLSSLVVGSDNGVYKYENNTFKSLITKEQLPNPSAYTLLIDDDQSIWVGTKGGIAHFSEQGINIKESFTKKLFGLQINAIFRDSQHALWILTESGVYKSNYDNKTRSQSNVIEHIGIGTTFEKSTFRAITELNNQIYLGSHVGLLSYDQNNGLVIDNNSHLKTFITSLGNYQNQLIVGTYSSGLFIKNNDEWVNLTKKDGLVFDSSFSVNQFNKTLWVSGFDGVYSLSFDSVDNFINGIDNVLLAKAILKDSGYIPGSQKAYCCNGAGHAKSALIDNDLWFPTRKGILKLEPDKVIRNKQLVTTVIETIGKPEYLFDLYHYPLKDPVASGIHFNQRDISISFIGLTSHDEDLVKYRYRLKGYSDKWINNGSNRIVSYTNLHHGKYVFEVIASNNNGLWAKSPSQLGFIINPRYYETAYFKFFLVVLGGLFLFGLYKLAIYRNRIKVETLEAKIAEKTKALVISNIKLAEANEKLSIYSYTDSLTGVYNRRYLDKQIKGDIAHYTRFYQKASSVQNIVFLMVDIDYFKTVNDDYGHKSGDEVLKQFVICLQDNIRDGDYLIRWGGEEFLIVLRPEHVSGIEEMCSRLLHKIANTPFKVAPNQLIKMTASLGYCYYPLLKEVTKDWSWLDALDIADKGLYQAKSNGRNQWVGYQFLPHVIDHFKDNGVSYTTLNSFQQFSGAGPQ